MNRTIKMKAARATYAGRVTVSPATYKTVTTILGDTRKVIDQPRVRSRAPRRQSFRAWAREHYAGMPNLSPTLQRIVEAR